ncbi:hypothetical protein MYX84_10565 [Acidobacteria bacterium AH-259-O06]|nr:hypothetical protein [Acidobacteria bacterium AH-259-O06]
MKRSQDDLAGDQGRLGVRSRGVAAARPPLAPNSDVANVVLNWFEELKRLVPRGN